MLMVVARIVEKQNEEYKTLGYRLVDCNKVGTDNIVTDMRTEELIKRIKGGLKVGNVEVDSKEGLHGTNGSLGRYTVLDIKGRPLANTALVILFRAKSGFLCSNYCGECRYLDTNKATELSIKQGISNGKVVTRNNKKIISSINGEYPDAPMEYKKREKEIIVVSSEHPTEKTFGNIMQSKNRRVIGKLNASATDKVIRYCIKKCELLKSVEQQDNAKIDSACNYTLKFLELVTRVGDKKKISEHANGLKHVKKELGDEESLLSKVIRLNQEKEVVFR